MEANCVKEERILVDIERQVEFSSTVGAVVHRRLKWPRSICATRIEQ